MSRPLFPPRVGDVLSNGNDLRLPPVFEALVSHPMVDDFTMRAHRQRARSQPAGIPMQYSLPLRNHPMWSGNNELGRETPFEADANNRQTVVKLEEWGPPEVWSVMLGISFTPPSGLSADPFTVIAHVETGVGGTVQSFDVDWSEGMTFSAVMNALTVIAEFDAIGEIPTDLRLTATICRGKVSDLPPTRTIYYENIPGGSSMSLPIPKFARRVYLIDSNNAGPDVISAQGEITMNAQENGGARLHIALGTTLLDLYPLPIPNGARWLQIGNGGAVPPAPGMNVAAIYELGF